MFYKKSPTLSAEYSRSATFVVAASNASTKIKAAADYVCDGTADQTEIQAALDALPAGGGKTLLSEGTFYLSATVTLGSNKTLEGQGGSTILQQAADAANAITCTTAANSLSIRSIRFRSNATKAGAAIRIDRNRGVSISNIWVDATSQSNRWRYGLQIEDSSTTSNCRFVHVEDFNIQSIHNAADSAGIYVKQSTTAAVDGTYGYSNHFNNGIIQTWADDSDTVYTTPGYCGLWIERVDGHHFSNIEVIDFAKPLQILTAGGGDVWNSKFVSCSFEIAASGNAAGLISTSSDTGDIIRGRGFSDRTFFSMGLIASDGLRVGCGGVNSIADLEFSSCQFYGYTDEAVDLDAGSGTLNRLRFGVCSMRGSGTTPTGMAIRAGVTGLTVETCNFFDLTTGIDVDGSDDKNLVIQGNDFSVAVTTPLDLSGYSGSLAGVVATGNIPFKANLLRRKLLTYLTADDFILAAGTPGKTSLGSAPNQYVGWAMDSAGAEEIVSMRHIIIPDDISRDTAYDYLEFDIILAAGAATAPVAGEGVAFYVGTSVIDNGALLTLGRSIGSSVDLADLTAQGCNAQHDRATVSVSYTSWVFSPGQLVRFHVRRNPGAANDDYLQDIHVVGFAVYYYKAL